MAAVAGAGGAATLVGDRIGRVALLALGAVVAVWVLVVGAAMARAVVSSDRATHAAMEQIVTTVTGAVVALLTLTPPERPARPRRNATGQGG